MEQAPYFNEKYTSSTKMEIFNKIKNTCNNIAVGKEDFMDYLNAQWDNLCMALAAGIEAVLELFS